MNGVPPPADAYLPFPYRPAKSSGTNPSGAAVSGTTPVPNALFDVVMPTLSDTQLRVLLVVTRSTLGWREGDGRKERDWLSHRQLQSRTGRAGAAVSGAIDTLVRRGLLEVHDSAGQWRSTTSARRAARGPLFYRLGRALIAQEALTSQNEVENRGRNHTDERPSSVSVPLPPTISGFESASTSERRLHKAKTTKEIQTKERKYSTEISFDLSSLGSEVLRISEQKIAQLQGSTQETSGKRETKVAAAEKLVDREVGTETAAILAEETEAFVQHYRSAYADSRPGQTCPPIESGDLSLLGRYIEAHGTPFLERWLPAFFASDFGYVRRRLWSLGSYLNTIFVLQARANTIRTSTGRFYSGK